MASHHFMANKFGKKWKQWQILFSWSPKSLWTVTAATKLKDSCSLEERVWQTFAVVVQWLSRVLVFMAPLNYSTRQHFKKQSITLPTKVHLVKAMVFPVVIYGYENWTIKKAECQIIDAFKLWCWRSLLRVPWTARRSNQSILNQSWIFIGRTDAETETPILWPPDAKNWLVGKDPDAGKDWR